MISLKKSWSTIGVEGLWHVPEVLIVSHARSPSPTTRKPDVYKQEEIYAHSYFYLVLVITEQGD